MLSHFALPGLNTHSRPQARTTIVEVNVGGGTGFYRGVTNPPPRPQARPTIVEVNVGGGTGLYGCVPSPPPASQPRPAAASRAQPPAPAAASLPESARR